MTQLPRVELFTRSGCHLCEDAKAILLALQGAYDFTFVETDITTDPVLLARYGEEIPVVLINGQKAGKYRVDRAYISRLLRRFQRHPWRFFT